MTGVVNMAKKTYKTKPTGQNVRVSGVSGGQVNVAGGDVRQENRTVNTGGGVYIEGSVEVQGDFAGRDKITSGYQPEEAARLFAAIYQQIESAKERPAGERE